MIYLDIFALSLFIFTNKSVFSDETSSSLQS